MFTEDLKQIQRMAPLMQKVLIVDPAPASARMLGDLMRSRQRWAEAVGAYSEAIRRVQAPTGAHWPLFYARGVALERAGDWPAAEADFRDSAVRLREIEEAYFK